MGSELKMAGGEMKGHLERKMDESESRNAIPRSRALQAVRADPTLFRSLPPEFRADPEVVLEAVQTDAGALRWAATERNPMPVAFFHGREEEPLGAAHAELAPSSSMATAARANDDETNIECSANLTDVCYINWNTWHKKLFRHEL